ncbi:general substrate transporter [Mycena maculata]|uniref:General substrate transporter n=1 Tax=Mycena maculata TaxID=230809 RepID=A0AAD7I8E8_9AGAR|nr:general substrate transporter [Mycena maculata]
MVTKEHIFKNIRVYWLAFIVYWGIVLFGGGVVSAPFFLEQFGLLNPNGTTNVAKSNAISSNVVSVLQAGAFFGALWSAPMSARIGRRLTLLVFSVIFVVGAILTTVAGGGHRGLAEIYAGRVITGFGIGGISAVSPAFVSECSPKDVRGRITGLFQVFVAFGVMMSYWVNYGIGVHIQPGPKLWRIPFGIQLIPAGIMCFDLLTVKESPRWLAPVGRTEEAIANLSYLRKEPESSEAVIHEMAEIEAAIQEEREARQGLGLHEAFLGKGNFVRFVIAFVIFLLQQWSGQNSVNYYSPQIFASIGYTARRNGLLATGIYGVVKLVATCLFVSVGVEWLGRKASLFISAMGMGIGFFIIGAILKTHPPPAKSANSVVANPSPASKAMAAMLYIYVCFYSMGWGPLPWVYCSDIFPTRTRHYGMALASASQWLWNFTLTKTTPDMVTALGYKVGYLRIILIPRDLQAPDFPYVCHDQHRRDGDVFFGRSLEDMDVIFGSVTQEQRDAGIAKQERALDHQHNDETSDRDEKV